MMRTLLAAAAPELPVAAAFELLAADTGAWLAGGAELLVFPLAQAASVCHSASFCDFQCFPPLWKRSPPPSFASGCSRSLLARGLPATTTRETAWKFLRESSSFHVAAPGASGCNRSGVPAEWHDTQRAWPGRLAVKMGRTRVLK